MVLNSRQKALIAGGLIGMMALAAVYLIFRDQGNGGQTGEGPAASGLQAWAVGAVAGFATDSLRPPAPDIQFTDASGTVRHLSEWRGRVVLLNFWATWCSPCRKEMPALDALQAALGGADFEVVAVSLDRGEDQGPADFLRETGVSHLRLYHDGTVRAGAAFNVFGMPTTVLIGREGDILGRLVGPAEWDDGDAQALVRAAIAGE